MPAARSRAISASLLPSSPPSTSSVCSPSTGGAAAVFERRAREAHRARHHRQLARGGMVELDAHAARLDLRFLEHLRDIVDRAVRHARRLEQLQPLARAALLEDLGEQPRQLGAVLHALAVGGEARIASELGAARRLAELADRGCRCRRRGSTRRRRRGTAGTGRCWDAGCRCARAARRSRNSWCSGRRAARSANRAARDRGAGRLPDSARWASAAQIAIEAYMPVMMSAIGTPARCGPPPGRAVGLAGDAHHPAHALDHEVVARPLAVRTGLAESGHRAIDQAADSARAGRRSPGRSGRGRRTCSSRSARRTAPASSRTSAWPSAAAMLRVTDFLPRLAEVK